MCERIGDVSVLRFRRRFSQPRPAVWRALTEEQHLAEWFPTTVEGARAPGAPLRFSFRQGEAPPFDEQMLVFDPPSVMELRWADDVLRFEVAPDASGDGCVLDLTVSFPEHGKGARDAAGWHVSLEQLVLALDGSTSSWDAPDRWRTVYAVYLRRLGSEAATIGPPDAVS